MRTFNANRKGNKNEENIHELWHSTTLLNWHCDQKIQHYYLLQQESSFFYRPWYSVKALPHYCFVLRLELHATIVRIQSGTSMTQFMFGEQFWSNFIISPGCNYKSKQKFIYCLTIFVIHCSISTVIKRNKMWKPTMTFIFTRHT